MRPGVKTCDTLKEKKRDLEIHLVARDYNFNKVVKRKLEQEMYKLKIL